MTDKISALQVILEENVRDDDVGLLVFAIKQLRGVLDVKPHVADITDQQVGYSRAKREIERRLWDALDDNKDKGRRA